jgi:hypothetical protein
MHETGGQNALQGITSSIVVMGGRRNIAAGRRREWMLRR